MSTAKELCDGVPRSYLDTPVSDIHISDICSKITEWQELAPYLDLSVVDEKDIVDSYPNRPNLQRRQAFIKWKELNGSKATYRKLICILCSQGRLGTAEYLKEVLLSKSGSQPDRVIQNFYQYLCDCYSMEMCHPSFQQWPFSSNHSYVPLLLYDSPLSSNSDGKSASKQLQIDLKCIFSVGSTKAKRQVVLLEGLAGSGKSTLCWYACKEWGEGRFFTDFRLVIHLSISDTVIHSATKLADLIPHPSEEMRETVASAIADMRGRRICFLLDGCDEAPQLFMRGSFLFKFVEGSGRSKLPNVSIILTSRPVNLPNLFNCITRKVVIKGFTSLDQFITVTIKEDSAKRARILEAFDMKPELYSLCQLPLHAVILIHLFDFFRENLPTTRTGLFHPLVCNFLVRHMQMRTAYEEKVIVDLSVDLPDEVYSSLCKVSKLAYESLLSGKVAITPSILQAAGINPMHDDTFGFLQLQRTITMYGPKNLHIFPHLSLQEFLAGLHITQLKESEHITAFEAVFKQNPLSSVLSFYAGLTKLGSKDICNLLSRVLNGPYDLPSIAGTLQQTGDTTHDIRRQILALMNCVYESQNSAVLSHIQLCPTSLDDNVVLDSDWASTQGSNRTVEVSLPYMQLYPTDCSAIGFFTRHACGLLKEPIPIILDLSLCPIGTNEIKALCDELCKPMPRWKLSLKMMYVILTSEGLKFISRLITFQPGLAGVIVTGCFIEDIQLAFKYFIEGLSCNPVPYLSVTDIVSSDNMPIAHHLVLLLTFCEQLKTLNICGSGCVFKNPKVMPLFCEALKHSRLTRLFLDNCSIDDRSLQYLANALTDGCIIQALDIGWNPYTSKGLTQFLNTLVRRAVLTVICVLSTNDTLSDEHYSLVSQFNLKRKRYINFPLELHIACKHKNWAKEADSLKFLLSKPQYFKRN